jgi:hypothetical protein
MSADGNVKFAPVSHPLGMDRASHTQPGRRPRTCALCELPLRGHPVLLKSGHSVHVECYFLMQKHPPHRRPN